MKKAALKNFAIFTGKLQTCNSIKNRLQHRFFHLNIAKFLRAPISKSIGSVRSCFYIDSFIKFRGGGGGGWLEKFIKSNKRGGRNKRGRSDFYYFYDQNLVICYKICLQTCFTNFWKGIVENKKTKFSQAKQIFFTFF